MLDQWQIIGLNKNVKVHLDMKEKKRGLGNKGVALYMSVVVMSILFSVAFGMSAVSVARIKSFNSIGNSVVAFYAADAGAEQGSKESINAAYEIPYAYLDTNDNGYEDENDAKYEVRGVVPGAGDCPISVEYCLKSIGTYMGTKRSIQLIFR
jgi:hypothetical protein